MKRTVYCVWSNLIDSRYIKIMMIIWIVLKKYSWIQYFYKFSTLLYTIVVSALCKQNLLEISLLCKRNYFCQFPSFSQLLKTLVTSERTSNFLDIKTRISPWPIGLDIDLKETFLIKRQNCKPEMSFFKWQFSSIKDVLKSGDMSRVSKKGNNQVHFNAL